MIGGDPDNQALPYNPGEEDLQDAQEPVPFMLHSSPEPEADSHENDNSEEKPIAERKVGYYLPKNT